MPAIDEDLASEGLCASIDTADGNPCTREAGDGIDQVVYRGRCREHTRRGSGTGGPDPEAMAGNDRAVGNAGGPPPGSQNALKIGLYADRDLLAENVTGDAAAWVEEVTDDLAADWAREAGQSPSDRFRRERLRPIATAGGAAQLFHRLSVSNPGIRSVRFSREKAAHRDEVTISLFVASPLCWFV